MGHRRPRTLLLGLVAVLVALGSQQSAGSEPVSGRVVRGGVGAAGELPAGAGWTLEHPDTGVYRITIPALEVDLDIPEWDQPADVTILPLGRDTVEVRFTQGRTPIDSQFTFVALVTG